MKARWNQMQCHVALFLLSINPYRQERHLRYRKSDDIGGSSFLAILPQFQQVGSVRITCLTELNSLKLFLFVMLLAIVIR